MYLKKAVDIVHTLAFRLTIWYAAVFTLSAGAVFLSFYVVIISSLKERIDTDLRERVGLFTRIQASDGLMAVKRFAQLESQATGEKKLFFRLLYPTGISFSSSTMTYWRDVGVTRTAIDRVVAGAGAVYETVAVNRSANRARIVYADIGSGIILQLGQSMEAVSRISETFQKLFAATVPPLVLLSALVGWFMARRALSGVANVTRIAGRISAASLEQRVPLGRRNDEIDRLAATFNRMLDRIQRLVKGIEEISDNVAHDLKSPLTRIRGNAEIALSTGGTIETFQHVAADTIEECDRLLSLINTMLFISKTEAGVDRLERRPVDLTAAATQACALFQPIAGDKKIRLDCRKAPPVTIAGDLSMLQRMIANLIDNAIKYTPVRGRVIVDVRREKDEDVLITVSDTGIGIAPQNLARIFERFFRCDISRTQSGAGLGLSLARAIARAHGGDISVSSTVGQGSTFQVRLPLYFFSEDHTADA